MRILITLTFIATVGLTMGSAHAQRTIVRPDVNGKPTVIPTVTTMAGCKHNRTVLLKKPWTKEAQEYCRGIVARYGH